MHFSFMDNEICMADVKENISPSSSDKLIYIDVCQKNNSATQPSEISKLIHSSLATIYKEKSGPQIGVRYQPPVNSPLHKDVEYILISSDDESILQSQNITSSDEVVINVFQLFDSQPGAEDLDDDGDGTAVSASNHWVLPSREFDGLWSTLIYDVNIKSKLLNYVSTTLFLSDHNIDPNIISWNRVVLLHGPPGTGKTSLCKALAQQLSIRLSGRYKYGQLIEINSHSLFSKWFSESGKLVQKMFQKIQQLIDDPDALVCVLIDEVESLTAARKAGLAGNEPSDAIRVVNALLTQLDQIKRHPNVLILTTSNVTGGIDLAFIDRADIKQYIGLPTAEAIYTIYQSCVIELIQKNVICSKSDSVLHHSLLKRLDRKLSADGNSLSGAVPTGQGRTNERSQRLFAVARRSVGLSGRTLRKLPFLALATTTQHRRAPPNSKITLDQFISDLDRVVTVQFAERNALEQS